MKACQSGDKQACAQKTKELVAYEKAVDEEDIDAEYLQYNLGGYSLLGIDKALGKQLTSVSNIGKDATGVVKHFVLKRNSRQGAVKSVLDTGGAVLAGAAVVGGCVATGGIPCLIGATAGGLGAFNSANYLYGDAQQAWMGKAHSTALISTAKRLGASSSAANLYQQYADIATAGTAALDLGVGAFSLASGTARLLNGADRTVSNVGEDLSASARQAIRLDVPTSKSTIHLNAVDSQAGERLASVGESTGSGDIVKDIPQGELKYPGIERLPESTAKAGDGVGKGGGQFWTSPTTFKGNKVFQRNDLIDPWLVDARGRTNLERMQKGLAPIGPDGKSINLHHMTQRHNGSIAEVTQTFHQQNSKTIHINPNSTLSGIDRSAFNKWRTDYWKSRTNGF
ncbi:MAG: hypothetical protein CENE_03025 [Candidatus Celerinatantimonas neptuna]|nr:MAG: hypothetical protein CENE_03025 [Candidatus Celerinatantimonas neptuna]